MGKQCLPLVVVKFLCCSDFIRFIFLYFRWGTVAFANSSDCRNAEAECSNKSINGRPVRAEIGNTSERYRSDDGFRGGRGTGRPYHGE